MPSLRHMLFVLRKAWRGQTFSLRNIPGMSIAERVTALCDLQNEEAGKTLLEWILMTPEDEKATLMACRPDTGEFTGEHAILGGRIRIRYATPIRLPLGDADGNAYIANVCSIVGVLSDPEVLTDVTMECCDRRNHDRRYTLDISFAPFRVFLGDEIDCLVP